MISADVNLILRLSTALRYCLAASLTGSDSVVDSSTLAGAPAPVGVPEADTTPALSNALKRLAMLFVGGGGAFEVTGAGWTADSRPPRSMGSGFGAPYAVEGAKGR